MYIVLFILSIIGIFALGLVAWFADMKRKEEAKCFNELQTLNEKIIIDEIKEQNKFHLGILKEPMPLADIKETDKVHYGIYGVSVFDPTKSFVINVEIEEWKPWYKRLWSRIKKMLKK